MNDTCVTCGKELTCWEVECLVDKCATCIDFYDDDSEWPDITDSDGR